jgi:hypothetical protein
MWTGSPDTRFPPAKRSTIVRRGFMELRAESVLV